MNFRQILAPIIKNVPLIYDIAKKIFDFIADINVKDTPQINQKSSVQDVHKMAEVLEDIRYNAERMSIPFIQDIKDNIAFYIEELKFLMNDKTKILSKYNFSNHSFDDTLNELNSSIQVFWSNELRKQISFDNEECRSILVLPAGKKKEADMQNFIAKVIQEATIAYTKYIEGILHRLYDDFVEDIAEVTKRLEINLEAYKQLDISILNKDNSLYAQAIKQAQIKVLICGEIINRLEK